MLGIVILLQLVLSILILATEYHGISLPVPVVISIHGISDQYCTDPEGGTTIKCEGIHSLIHWYQAGFVSVAGVIGEYMLWAISIKGFTLGILDCWHIQTS